VSIEDKGKSAYTARVYNRVAFASNVKPEIQNKTSDVPRALVIVVSPRTEHRTTHRLLPSSMFLRVREKSRAETPLTSNIR